MRSSLLSLIIIFSANLFAQNIPLLSDTELLRKEDIGKKIGWMKIGLDSNFKKTEKENLVRYEGYEFCKLKGWFYSPIPKVFDHKNSTIIYKRTDPNSKSKLLNGVIDIYDDKERLLCRCVLQDGFLMKEYDLFKDYGLFDGGDKHNGHLYGVCEFSYTNKSIEMYGNFFNKEGKYDYDAHDSFDGYEWTQLPGNKSLEPWTVEVSEGWSSSFNNFWQYKMFIDPSGHDGKKAASIKSIEQNIKDGTGVMVQRFSAEKYLGKRVRMTAYVRSENITKWSGLWLRVDQLGSKQYLSFDNMYDRSIKGTTAWTKYEIVLDVPTNASTINFGALMEGSGQIWFDDFNFEVVDKSVNTTGVVSKEESKPIQKEPTNLNFGK